MSVSYFNIPDGYAGTAETIKRMEDLVQQGKVHPDIIAKATEIVRGVPAKDYEGEARAIFNWVKQNVRYTRDPNGAEMLQAPWVTLKRRAADCDCSSTLLNSLAEAVGLRTGFSTVKADRANPGEFSHVYSVIQTPAGWRGADVTVPTSYFGWKPTKGVTARQDWVEGVPKVANTGYQGVQGMSTSSYVNASDLKRVGLTSQASGKLARYERDQADSYMARQAKKEQLRRRLHAKLTARQRQIMDAQGVRLSGLGSAGVAQGKAQITEKIKKIYSQAAVPIYDRVPYPPNVKLRTRPDNWLPRKDDGSLREVPFDPAVQLKNQLIEQYAVPPDQAHMLASNAIDRWQQLERQQQIAAPSAQFTPDSYVPYFKVSMTSPAQYPTNEFGNSGFAGLGQAEGSIPKWLVLAAGAGLVIYLLKKAKTVQAK